MPFSVIEIFEYCMVSPISYVQNTTPSIKPASLNKCRYRAHRKSLICKHSAAICSLGLKSASSSPMYKRLNIVNNGRRISVMPAFIRGICAFISMFSPLIDIVIRGLGNDYKGMNKNIDTKKLQKDIAKLGILAIEASDAVPPECMQDAAAAVKQSTTPSAQIK